MDYFPAKDADLVSIASSWTRREVVRSLQADAKKSAEADDAGRGADGDVLRRHAEGEPQGRPQPADVDFCATKARRCSTRA